MPTREQLHKEVDAVPEDQLDNAQVLVLEPNGAGTDNGDDPVDDGDSEAAEPTKVGRLSFFGIGEGDPPDASERVDEFVALAIDRRHPSS